MNDITMEEIHGKILEIAVYFDEFCKANGLKYYLMGGSALGAVRHKGFIPWDDDLDVFMKYDEYHRMLSIAKDELDSKRFYLQAEDTDEWPGMFSKLRMNNTTFIESGFKMKRGAHQGFFIDIMCLYNTPKNKALRFVQYSAARLITAKTQYLKGYETGNPVKRFAMNLANVLIGKRMRRFLMSVIEAWNDKPTGYVGHFFGRAPFSKTSFPESWLGDQRYVPFETARFPVQSQVEKYLAMRFGDYMKLPNVKEKAKYPSHAAYVDPYKDYTEYLK